MPVFNKSWVPPQAETIDGLEMLLSFSYWIICKVQKFFLFLRKNSILCQRYLYSLDLDLTFLLRYYRKKLDVDREAIAEKLDVITGQKCAINDDFDNIIKNIMDNIIEDDETKIKGNFSYNMSYFEVFQTIYLNEMLKN